MPRLPDFFIVGAPKSGTTALADFLVQHPDVFMPEREPAFFGSDLRFLRTPRTHADYEALFAHAPEPVVGEKSVLYLYSQRAAGEIHAACPQAKIIAMLRNPVDMMHSWHAEALWSNNEDIPDFAAALAAEPDRAAGRRIPIAAGTLDATRYRAIARYAAQLRRYFDVFGRDAVHVIVFEEFVADLESGYRAVAAYLGLDTSFTPRFGVINPRKVRRSEAASRVGALFVRRWGPRLGLRALPPGVKGRLIGLYGRFARWNARTAGPESLDPGLRAALVAEFADEVTAVEVLLGRELPAWRR